MAPHFFGLRTMTISFPSLGDVCAQQAPAMEIAIISIGGGGLAAGAGSAIKQMLPRCRILASNRKGLIRCIGASNLESQNLFQKLIR